MSPHLLLIQCSASAVVVCGGNFVSIPYNKKTKWLTCDVSGSLTFAKLRMWATKDILTCVHSDSSNIYNNTSNREEDLKQTTH